jgi:hypothetical protein
MTQGTPHELRQGIFVTPEVQKATVDRLYDAYFGPGSTYGTVRHAERYEVLGDLVERGLITWTWEYTGLMDRLNVSRDDWERTEDLLDADEDDEDAYDAFVNVGTKEQEERARKDAGALSAILGDLYGGRWLPYMPQIRQWIQEVEHDPGSAYETMTLSEWFEDLARWIHYGRD